MDAGELVPDEVIIGVILEKVEAAEAADGFVLDGFPRTIAQAEALDDAFAKLGRALTAAILLEVPDEDIVRRLSGRRVSKRAARTTSTSTRRRCRASATSTASDLIQRDDDKPEVVRKRLDVYHSQTAPLVAYYEDKGLLRRFDGTLPPTEVHDHIRATIATLRLEDETLIIKKSPAEIDAMAAAGAILVRTLRLVESKIRPGVTTLDLDAAAERYIRSQGATPAFKGYRGFPGSLCTSPNEMVVHGIPGSYELKRGDVISVDCGVVLEGWVADAARTFTVGGDAAATPLVRKLLDTTKQSLFDAVPQCTAGNHLGDVSNAVQTRVEGEGLSIVRSLVGHGIGRSCTRTPRSRTSGSPGGDPSWRRVWSSPWSRWSRPGATRSGWATTTGRSTRRTARWPPTSSSRSPSRPVARGSSRRGTRPSEAFVLSLSGASS